LNNEYVVKFIDDPYTPGYSIYNVNTHVHSKSSDIDDLLINDINNIINGNIIIDKNVQDLLVKRYFLKDMNNELIEHTWEDVCKRVSANIANAETDKKLKVKYEKIFKDMMMKMEFIPSSPTLFNAGTTLQQLSSCFILEIEDSMESIMDLAKDMSIVFKSGGGVGFNISPLRPKDDIVLTSNGYASGVVSFMGIYDKIVETVKQGGRRKGALKIDLNDHHPEIIEFIHCKDDTENYKNMNISVSLSDDFMNALLKGKWWDLNFNGKVHKPIQAKELWNHLVECAWRTGEPGVSFRDTMDKANMNPHLGRIIGSNPCLHKDTLLLTENGYEKISELKSDIWNGEEFTPATSWKTGVKYTIKVNTNNNCEYIVTPDHKFKLSNENWCEAKDLLGKELLCDDGLTNVKVTNIEEYGDVEVWDFNEPKLNQAVAINAVYVHNCAEFVNISYSSCNLGSINLAKMVEGNAINYKKLSELVEHSVRFLDNVVTINKLPLPKIQEVTNMIRSIGLGTMGYADMLYMLNIPYNSQEAYDLTDELYKYIYDVSVSTSCILANEKGVYPAYEGSVWQKQGILIRNSNLLSIAPTGSISFIAKTSSGVEPNFALVFKRKANDGTIYYIVNSVLENRLKELDIYSEELIEKVFNNNGSVQGIDEIPDDIKRVFVVASDLTPMEHLKTVAIVQKHVDLSLSKTVNLPKSATVDDVSNVYIEAWKMGLKGVTVYRDGSRENVLSTGNTEDKKEIVEVKEKTTKRLARGSIITSKKEAKGKRLKLTTGCGAIWLMCFVDCNNKIIETFINTGSKGGCVASTQAMSRLISIALRGGISLEDVVDQLDSVGSCPAYLYAKGKGTRVSPGTSCPSAIARALIKYQKALKDGNNTKQIIEENIILEEESEVAINDLTKCPECNELLLPDGGCSVCSNCGFSKCN